MIHLPLTHDERHQAEDLLKRAAQGGIDLVHGPVYIIKHWSPLVGELLKSGDLLSRHYLTVAQRQYRYRAQLLSTDPDGAGLLEVAEMVTPTLAKEF